VLCVVDNFQVGGVREVVLAQISSLDGDRFDLGVLTLGGDLDLIGELVPSHVTVLAPPYQPAHGYGLFDYLADGILLRTARRFGSAIVDEIDRFAAHVLHFHTNPRELGLGILADRRSPTALVFTDHLVRLRPTDYSRPARVLLRASYRRLYRHFNIISVGPSVARFNRQAGFLNPARDHLLLESQVDLHTFHPPTLDRSDAPVEIVYVGRIHQVKGIDTLSRAFGKLHVGQPVRLVLVGPDLMAGAMEALAKECVRAPLYVDFVGPRPDVSALLQRASIGVLPSRREGLSLALLEQMASALPLVVSDIPELGDFVSDGVNGLVVPVDDVSALATALQTLVQDRALRTRLGQGARDSIERRARKDAASELARFDETVAPPTNQPAPS
jgi:glycosyltransferase involved in cell wall biosynthesis